MNYTEAFDLVDAGAGRWDVQHHGTLLVAGQIWRTNDGFDLMDWLDRPIGHFDFVENALWFLLSPPDATPFSGRLPKRSRPVPGAVTVSYLLTRWRVTGIA